MKSAYEQLTAIMKFKLKLVTDNDGIAVIDMDAESPITASERVEAVAANWIRTTTKNATSPVIKVWWSLFDELGNDAFHAVNFLVLGNPNYLPTQSETANRSPAAGRNNLS